MWYVSHKLGKDVKGSVLKYHTDPMIRSGDICEKQRLSAAEINSSRIRDKIQRGVKLNSMKNDFKEMTHFK